MITESLINDSCVQEFFWYTIVSRHVISSWLLTNCAVTSNICFNVRLSSFCTTFCMVEEFFPMNVIAFNVVAMNIPQVIECSVQFSSMFDILFCRIRTWFLTFLINSVISFPGDSLKRVAPFYREIVSSIFAEHAVLPRRYFSRWGSTFCNESKEFLSGCPGRSCSPSPLFHSWEDQDRP